MGNAGYGRGKGALATHCRGWCVIDAPTAPHLRRIDALIRLWTEAFAAFIESDVARIGKLIKSAGIKKE